MNTNKNIKIDLVPIIENNHNDKPKRLVKFVEQYVKRVRGFSSQYGSNISISYTAYNLVGSPSKFPNYGDFPQAFVMRTYGNWWDHAPSRSTDYMYQNNELIDSHDYVDIEYYTEVYPIRVSIYETYNPGSVIKIWARDSSGHWLQLWSGFPQKISHKPRIFSPPLNSCKFKTKILRIEFNHSLLDYYTELDAVLLIGTTELLLPHDNFQTISVLLQQLGSHYANHNDLYNLTPDNLKINYDLEVFKSDLPRYCALYKNIIFDNDLKGTLVSQIKLNCQHLPPISESINVLQRFLQDDFLKLIKDINNSSALTTTQPLTTCVKSVNNQCFSKSCGNFCILPDEMILKILSNLDLKSLSRISRVNKYFNMIAQDTLLYTSLNLKPYWYCFNTRTLELFIPKCQLLRRLDLSWCGNDNFLQSQNIANFFTLCGHHLTHLRLNCCQFVNDSVIETISTTCEYLKELCLRHCTAITNDGFYYLSKLNNLERLELYRTLIETSNLCLILRNNPRMRHLNLAGLTDYLNMDVVVEEITCSCPYVESIDFWKIRTLTSAGIRTLSSCVNLREVDFGWCTGITAIGDALRIFFATCRHLEKVFLTALRNLSDRDIEPLLLCHQLQQLDLLGARYLTPEICIRFLLCCPKLKLIDLSFCDSISDTKIEEWRELYPHVSIKRSFRLTDFHVGDNM
ncbi:F-box/LRR-repeat protein 4 [Chelonus insularis]|uniref:F-box/LRR-repeat protein 4 n=1 Tax=Chelonus insularis TaxID=460826 RepID=UPI00158AAC4A|nr:F-box/LRR-repeat protein 4 [Chelonus insularis]